MQKDTKRLFVLCVLVFGILINFASPAAQAEPAQWVANGHWYDVVDAHAINWLEANAVANAQQFNGLKGHLVTITSEAENQFLVDTFGTNLIVDRWIGAFQTEGAPEPDSGWTWVTGEFWDYTNWSVSEPNNYGGNENAIIIAGGALWNDIDATVNTHWIPGYVIEYETTLLERVEVLESQVEALTLQIVDLQKGLEEHSHTYLTGKGEGHNNTKAKTGSATFPATP